MPIGPSLPPHLAHLTGSSRSPSPPRRPDSSADDEDEDEDEYGPALPPILPSQAGPSHPIPSVPQIPSRPLRPTSPIADDDESDDEIGPKPIPTAGIVQEKSAVEEFLEREARWAKEREEASKPKKLEREEWMLVPPTSGVLASVDPLRKRPTTFSRRTAPPNTDTSIWTETPAEKAQRIADEVAGIKRKVPIKSGEGAGEDEVDLARKRKRDREILQGVERHNKEQRGASLLEKHAKAKAEGKGKGEDEKGIWDHDRDMGITGRLLSDHERQAKIRVSDAKGLNDRFGHSKRGAYDM